MSEFISSVDALAALGNKARERRVTPNDIHYLALDMLYKSGLENFDFQDTVRKLGVLRDALIYEQFQLEKGSESNKINQALRELGALLLGIEIVQKVHRLPRSR